jgi:hypothetical protein
MLSVALAMFAILMALTSGADGARGGQTTYTLEFVSTTPADLTHPYPRANFDVSRQAQKRTNLSYLVQLVTHCDPDDYVGDWTYTDGVAWVSSSGERSHLGYYPGAPCQAWVYQVGAPGGYLNPDSNVVSLSG